MKYRIITALTSIILGIGGVCANASNFETWYVNANSGLNCRTSPEITENNIITTYEQGTPLEIIGVDSTGDWWETWNGETQGWCYKNYLSSTEEEATTQIVDTNTDTNGMTYIGNFFCTTYTPDPSENGGSAYTAKGDLLTDAVGYAIAVDPSVIPYNTKVYIEGIGYRVARDCGGAIIGNHIDVLAWTNTMEELGGSSYHDVYIVN